MAGREQLPSTLTLTVRTPASLGGDPLGSVSHFWPTWYDILRFRPVALDWPAWGARDPSRTQ